MEKICQHKFATDSEAIASKLTEEEKKPKRTTTAQQELDKVSWFIASKTMTLIKQDNAKLHQEVSELRAQVVALTTLVNANN